MGVSAGFSWSDRESASSVSGRAVLLVIAVSTLLSTCCRVVSFMDKSLVETFEIAGSFSTIFTPALDDLTFFFRVFGSAG